MLSELLARVVPTATAARSAATATDGVQRVGCVASNDALRSPEPRDRCMVQSFSGLGLDHTALALYHTGV